MSHASTPAVQHMLFFPGTSDPFKRLSQIPSLLCVNSSRCPCRSEQNPKCLLKVSQELHLFLAITSHLFPASVFLTHFFLANCVLPDLCAFSILLLSETFLTTANTAFLWAQSLHSLFLQPALFPKLLSPSNGWPSY